MVHETKTLWWLNVIELDKSTNTAWYNSQKETFSSDTMAYSMDFVARLVLLCFWDRRKEKYIQTTTILLHPRSKWFALAANQDYFGADGGRFWGLKSWNPCSQLLGDILRFDLLKWQKERERNMYEHVLLETWRQKMALEKLCRMFLAIAVWVLIH